MKNGVPFDAAFNLVEGGPEGETEAMAMAVVFGEIEGSTFNWSSMVWEKRE